MSHSVAIIVGSTRPTRIGPSIATGIHTIFCKHNEQRKTRLQIDIIDLAEQDLPLYDEPDIPAHHPKANPTPHYKHEHTRRWSATISKYDAFVFVTPQYNWSIPAVLKNALDYLYHEWSQKIGLVVSYGSRGGGKGAEHLIQIMRGLKMTAVSHTVGLEIKEGMWAGVEPTGERAEMLERVWQEQGKDVALKEGLDEIVALLGKDDQQAANRE